MFGDALLKPEDRRKKNAGFSKAAKRNRIGCTGKPSRASVDSALKSKSNLFSARFEELLPDLVQAQLHRHSSHSAEPYANRLQRKLFPTPTVREGLAGRFYRRMSGHALITPLREEGWNSIDSDTCWRCAGGKRQQGASPGRRKFRCHGEVSVGTRTGKEEALSKDEEGLLVGKRRLWEDSPSKELLADPRYTEAPQGRSYTTIETLLYFSLFCFSRTLSFFPPLLNSTRFPGIKGVAR